MAEKCERKCKRECLRGQRRAKEVCASERCTRVCAKVDRIASLGVGSLLILGPGISIITLWLLGEGDPSWIDPKSLLFGINHLLVSVCVTATLITDIDGADACRCGKWRGIDETAMAFSRTFLWFMAMVYGSFSLIHLSDWGRKAFVHGLLATSTAASCAFVRARDLKGKWEAEPVYTGRG